MFLENMVSWLSVVIWNYIEFSFHLKGLLPMDAHGLPL